jgi:hypothetical protein
MGETFSTGEKQTPGFGGAAKAPSPEGGVRVYGVSGGGGGGPAYDGGTCRIDTAASRSTAAEAP